MTSNRVTPPPSAGSATRIDRQPRAGRQALVDAVDRVRLAAGEAERRGRLAGEELERQDAHPHEVGAVDPLVALGDDRPDAEQARPLRGPVARGAGAVLAPGDDEERHALVGVAHGRVVDERLGRVRQVDRVRPLRALDEPVAQPDVAEGAAHHHLVMAAASAVAVEVDRRDAVRLEPGPGRAPGRDRPGRRDVVGGDGVAEEREDARAGDRRGRHRVGAHPGEERRVGDVRGRRVPRVPVAVGHGQRPPAIVAGEDVGVRAREQLRRDGAPRSRRAPPRDPARSRRA